MRQDKEVKVVVYLAARHEHVWAEVVIRLHVSSGRHYMAASFTFRPLFLQERYTGRYVFIGKT
jgi:hypothetical protein